MEILPVKARSLPLVHKWNRTAISAKSAIFKDIDNLRRILVAIEGLMTASIPLSPVKKLSCA